MTDFEPTDFPADVTQDFVQQKLQQLNLQDMGLQENLNHLRIESSNSGMNQS
mgnify:FL=1